MPILRHQALLTIVAALVGAGLGCGRIGYDPLGAVIDGGPGDIDAAQTAGGPLMIAPPDFTTTSPSFEDVPGGQTVIPDAPLAKAWLILVSARLGSTSTSTSGNGAELRYLIDGVEEGYGGVENNEANAGGPFMHFAITTAPPGSPIVVQAREAGGGVVSVGDLRIVLAPLNSEQAFGYASNNAIAGVLGGVETVIHQLNYAPDAAGEFLLLTAAAASEAPAQSDVFVTWSNPSGESFRYQNPRAAWQTQFDARIITLADTSLQTFALLGEAGAGATDGATIRASHIAVIPLANFTAILEREDRASLVVLSGTSLDLSLLSAPASPGGTLSIQRMRIRSCGLNLVREGLIETASGNVEFNHNMENCAYEAPYGAFGLAAPGAGTLSIRNVVSSTMGDDQVAGDSVGILLGF